MQARLVQFYNARHQPVDINGHNKHDGGLHQYQAYKVHVSEDAQRKDNNFRRQNKIRQHCAFDFVLLVLQQINRRIQQML